MCEGLWSRIDEMKIGTLVPAEATKVPPGPCWRADGIVHEFRGATAAPIRRRKALRREADAAGLEDVRVTAHFIRPATSSPAPGSSVAARS